MRTYKTNIIFFLLLSINCLLQNFCFGQTVQTFINKNEILIGEQIQYKVKATYLNSKYNIKWFAVPDTIAHFEVVAKSNIDSSIENDKITLTQTITYTSFDSGKWALPSLLIEAKALNKDSTIILKTDSFDINITYAAADSTNQLRDIKPIIEVSVADYFWYYVAGVTLLLLLLVWIIWRYVKKRKKNPQEIVNNLSAYDEAMEALKVLSANNLTDNAELKNYHSRLAEIFKRYFSRMAGKNVLNYTTGDILVQLSLAGVGKDEISDAAIALRCGDAVKFAKFKASIGESENCKTIITAIIEKLDRSFTKK
jgi:hypothetical protein